MDIIINGDKVDFQPLFPLTWKSFFQKLLQNHIPKDHGIVGVVVDGQEALNLMIEDSFKMVAQDTGEVQIATKDSISITKGGIKKIIALTESIKIEANQTADLYREGKIPEAAGKTAKIMKAIEPMVNFINSIGMGFSLNFDEMMFDAEITLRQKVDKFVSSLNEMISAQEKEDYVELADLLEYQLTEDMDDWTKLANLLVKEIDLSKGKSN